MQHVFEVINTELSLLNKRLLDLREAFDEADANNAAIQISIMQKITAVTIQIQTLKNLKHILQIEVDE